MKQPLPVRRITLREERATRQPGDPSALAQALEKLASQPALREKLAQAAARRSIEHYSWDLAVERLLAFAGACRTRAEHCA